MTTATTTRPITLPAVTTATALTLGNVVAAASDAVAQVPHQDDRWTTLGPQLTAFVDTARRVAGLPGSPIRPDEAAAAVLRVRDLARLAQATAGATVSALVAPTDLEVRLRWVQVAASR